MHKEDAGYECRGRGERAVLQPCAVTTVARSREWRQVPVGECLRKCLVLIVLRLRRGRLRERGTRRS